LKQAYLHIILCCLIGSLSASLFEAEGANFLVYGKDSIAAVSSKNIIQAGDTARVYGLPKEYQSLKEQSSKNRWTKRLFSLFFRESSPPNDKEAKRDIVNDYKPFEGKIIRNINITVLPPFGTNVENPDDRTDELKFFNRTHALTRESTVKSILQFKQGTAVKAAAIATSETQLRNAGYIYDARIAVVPVEGSDEFVDVNVVVRDKWTIGVDLHNLSSSKVNIEIFDRNILGTGNRAGLDFIYSNKYDRKFGIGGNYYYEDFAKKNINLSASYVDKIKENELELSAIRPLQPKVDYFGEISYRRNESRTARAGWDSITPDRRQQFSATVGRAFTLSEENAIRRVAIALRYKVKHPEYRNADYKSYMEDKLAPYKYTKNQLLLMQLSLYQNSYLREYMVYNFGNTEDIPQGYNLSMQLGYSNFSDSDIGDAAYGSLKASYGSSKILKGNLYLETAISSFFGKKPFGGVFKFDAKYFTPLFRWSDLRFRQFLSLNYSRLFHPDRYLGDRIYMGQHTTLPIRRWRDTRDGYEQLLLKSETDWFSNYQILGFRFLFYTFIDVGWINSKGSLFSSESFNYGIGLGIRLRNNFIVFNTIDFKIGYYPKLDQSGFFNFYKLKSSTPSIPPDFVPHIPEEIVVE